MRFWYQLGSILAPKTHQNRVLETSWGVLETVWSVLGASWRCLGASWRRLGASWERLGCVLGTSWRRLGHVLGRLGVLLERLGDVLGRLGEVLGVLARAIHYGRHKGVKNDWSELQFLEGCCCKKKQRCFTWNQSKKNNFDSILKDVDSFGNQNAPMMAPKTTKNQCQVRITRV